jgi:hypothetical protein
VSRRLGYSVSPAVYLPSGYANGATIEITSGVAQAFAGTPDAPSHRFLATIDAGESILVEGLQTGEVLSLQSANAFSYRAILGVPPPPPPDPPEGEIIESILAYWRCVEPGCTSADWVGQVIDWPSWAAYQTNARSGGNGRAVYSDSGEPLYPYMGSWASGCEVTVVSGRVLIIEWERGTDVWRATLLEVGETYVIALTHPEDGAMIESEDYAPGFSVILNNCEPQPLD